MMIHLPESGSWYMRGPPESPEHGSCHSPLLYSTTVPNIFEALYVVLDTLRLTLFRSSLCLPVQSCPSVFLANLNYLTVFEQALIIFVEIYFARILILIWHDVTRLDFTYFSSILWDFIGLRYWIILITFMFFWLQYGNFQWLPCFNFTWPDFAWRGPQFLV